MVFHEDIGATILLVNGHVEMYQRKTCIEIVNLGKRPLSDTGNPVSLCVGHSWVMVATTRGKSDARSFTHFPHSLPEVRFLTPLPSEYWTLTE